MKFAKIVFTTAGVWGFLVLSPLYFMLDIVGQKYPPPVTHPDFYYGFLGLAIVWQLAFLVIGRDPVRFKPMMVPAVFEKALYVISLLVLYVKGRIEIGQAAVGIPDLVLGSLFVAAFLRTPSAASRP